jgi:hypothetical protein
VSYFRPQKAGKIGPRTVHSFSDSTSRLSQNAGQVTIARVPIPNCLNRGVHPMRLCPVLCPPPNHTCCYRVMTQSDKRPRCMHLWQSVALHRTRCNLLILRATNLCKQGVTGSIPVTSTRFSMFGARSMGIGNVSCEVPRIALFILPSLAPYDLPLH